VVDILIDADTIRSPDLRHEVPTAVIDPFPYGEHGGKPFAIVSPLDADSIAKTGAVPVAPTRS
jgi:Xaa-Pro aminopeptidase